MADIFFNIFFFSFLILIQSFFLNNFGFYDILLPWIFYYYYISDNDFKVFFICLLAGYLKDSLSGGAFGVYLSSYLWFFFMIKLSSSYLNLGNRIFIICFGVAGVIINCFFIFVSNYQCFFDSSFRQKAFNSFLNEILYCVFTFIFLFYFFIRVREFGLMFKAFVERKLAQLSRI
ncbi:MAG: hypothetical protein RBR53_01720 [Desulforegulaceae bacterium]|nr:hypothetical protein [Desulforegulaceae bacterium]